MSKLCFERINPKTERYEEINDQLFAGLIRAKIVRDVQVDKFDPNWRTMIVFSDDSVMTIEEIVGDAKIRMRFLSKKERLG